MVADGWDRKKLKEVAIPIVESEGQMTLRGLHYKLVSQGMPNTTNCYKRLGAAMTDARWEGELDWDAFVDLDRDTVGETPYEETDVDSTVRNAFYQVEAWMRSYSKNRWENQPKYVEVWIEKKAMQYVFEPVLNDLEVLLFPCKGYPSLTWLNNASERFEEVVDAGKEPWILYFGDYDPSGEDIPRSIEENLFNMSTEINLERICLMEDQVRAWGLPPAPTKITDTRSRRWSGIGQVELDAVPTPQMKDLIRSSVSKHFDEDLHRELLNQQRTERAEFQKIMKQKVIEMSDELEDEEDE